MANIKPDLRETAKPLRPDLSDRWLREHDPVEQKRLSGVRAAIRRNRRKIASSGINLPKVR